MAEGRVRIIAEHRDPVDLDQLVIAVLLMLDERRAAEAPPTLDKDGEDRHRGEASS